MSFSGNVVIEGKKTNRPSKRITLHSKDLKIKSVKLILHDRSGMRDIKLIRFVYHKAYDELRLHSEETLYPGDYQIEIEFSGRITRPMNGLYPCYHKQGDNEEIILATQFESHHAREVFPCIDEPEAKAIFELSLISEKDEIVLSNTDPSEQRETKEGILSRFKPTPKMSTYLLAFIIGKLEYLEKVNKSGVRIRAYARSENVQHTAFALDVAVKSLDLYNEYFGIEYPLNKCDLVALPDFASGAMENWGLVTFREQALIVDPAITSLSMKQYVLNVVAHELTHQWFGNLVTMRWWNDLWLNESFATLMSYVAQDKLFPEWESWTQFIVDEQTPALRLDQLENTHPINVDIRHPDEIRTIFDNISYEKGASVLFMLKQFLGEDNFKNGLHVYLERHAYSNTESKDLWKAWEEVSNKPIADFMSAWTTQPGYPIINVKVDNNHVSLTQKRFYINPDALKQNVIWPIPLFSNVSLSHSVLGKVEQNLSFRAHAHPLIINHERNSFCRVVYDDKHTKLLSESVYKGKMKELDRLGLLSDSFDSAKAGFSETTKTLDLLKAYTNEDSVVVWEIISSNLSSLRTVMDNEKLREAMNPDIQKLILKQYKRLGWNEKSIDSHFDKLLRPIILGLACASEQPDAIKKAIEIFENRQLRPVISNLRGVVYTTVARHGDRNDFVQMVNMHNSSDNSEERLSLTAAITNFKQKELIKESLDLIKSEKVRLQDVAYWISDSFANRYAKELTWEWLKENWQWLKMNIGTDLSFYMMPRYVARAYSDDKFLSEFKKFFIANLGSSFNRPLDQAIETINWQAKWKKRDLNSLLEYYHAKKS